MAIEREALTEICETLNIYDCWRSRSPAKLPPTGPMFAARQRGAKAAGDLSSNTTQNYLIDRIRRSERKAREEASNFNLSDN